MERLFDNPMRRVLANCRRAMDENRDKASEQPQNGSEKLKKMPGAARKSQQTPGNYADEGGHVSDHAMERVQHGGLDSRQVVFPVTRRVPGEGPNTLAIACLQPDADTITGNSRCCASNARRSVKLRCAMVALRLGVTPSSLRPAALNDDGHADFSARRQSSDGSRCQRFAGRDILDHVGQKMPWMAMEDTAIECRLLTNCGACDGLANPRINALHYPRPRIQKMSGTAMARYGAISVHVHASEGVMLPPPVGRTENASAVPE
ncbi:hypothetical protein J2X35_001090 [Mesorhizobium sp. BE184]|nr:hypothetical protein [Mesorhizobium sp. BE184]